MDRIKINHFKPFRNAGINLKLGGKHLLLLGENGSGKTSICEALELFFYYDKILNIPSHLIGEARNAEIQTRLNKYRNGKELSTPIEIEVDDYKLDVADDYRSSVNAFFIGAKELRQNQDLSLDRILSTVRFPQTAINHLNLYWDKFFIEDVNRTLKEEFYEDIEIEIEQGGGHKFKLKATKRGLETSENVYDNFNEAAVHLIVLIILLKIVELNKESNKTNLLVLDDIITSLDAGNRGLIIKYIIKYFDGFQKIVLTHNVSFFNLFIYMKNAYISSKDHNPGWTEETLYIQKESPVLSKYKDEQTADGLIQERKNEGTNLNDLGNKIRQRFESLLYEIARLAQFGNFYETSQILDCLLNLKPQDFYICLKNGKLNNTYSLLNEIRNALKSGNDFRLKERLLEKFKEYDQSNNLIWLKETVTDMKMLQKVVLHQLSHTQRGHPHFQSAEIDAALYLLKKMEDFVEKGREMNGGGNVYII